MGNTAGKGRTVGAPALSGDALVGTASRLLRLDVFHEQRRNRTPTGEQTIYDCGIPVEHKKTAATQRLSRDRRTSRHLTSVGLSHEMVAIAHALGPATVKHEPRGVEEHG